MSAVSFPKAFRHFPKGFPFAPFGPDGLSCWARLLWVPPHLLDLQRRRLGLTLPLLLFQGMRCKQYPFPPFPIKITTQDSYRRNIVPDDCSMRKQEAFFNFCVLPFVAKPREVWKPSLPVAKPDAAYYSVAVTAAEK